jgi:hypothetical protein
MQNQLVQMDAAAETQLKALESENMCPITKSIADGVDLQFYFTKKNRAKLGPFSWSQMKAMASSCEVQPDDMILVEGMRKWVPANSISVLFETA